jgi:hypothetical protein
MAPKRCLLSDRPVPTRGPRAGGSLACSAWFRFDVAPAMPRRKSASTAKFRNNWSTVSRNFGACLGRLSRAPCLGRASANPGRRHWRFSQRFPIQSSVAPHRSAGAADDIARLLQSLNLIVGFLAPIWLSMGIEAANGVTSRGSGPEDLDRIAGGGHDRHTRHGFAYCPSLALPARKRSFTGSESRARRAARVGRKARSPILELDPVGPAAATSWALEFGPPGDV